METETHHLLGHDARPRKPWKRYVFGGLAGLLLIIAIAFVPAVLSLGEAYVNATAARDDLFRAQDAAERLAFDEAAAALEDATFRFAVARHAATRLGLIEALPFWKRDVEAVRALLEGGHEASSALHEAVAVAADFLSVLRSGAEAAASLPDISDDTRPVADLSRDEKRELLRRLTEAPDRLAEARAALDRALAAFDRVPRTGFTAGVLDALAPHRATLTELRDRLGTDLTLLSDLPAVLGYPSPKTYLFLLLNNTEIRPGGGFIGTYGIVRLADGEIDHFFTDDIYTLDGPAEATLHETPPEPIRRWLRASGWFMRDANWWPDFVVSSENVEKFYRLEGGKEELDGVIGVTPEVIKRLLAVTGPITIDGSTFTSENVTDELEYRVEIAFAADGVPVAQRKEIVGKLGQELVRRLLAMPLSRLSELGKIATDALEEKHLMLTFEDPTLMAAADARHWSGRVPFADADRLLVVDANLASLKTDPAVERTVSYRLRPDGDGWIARAQVTYRNRGRFDWKTTRYRTYTRFYVPPGSAFLKGEGAMQDDRLNDPARRPGTYDVGRELGHDVFGAFISVEPGETRTLAVEYRVSDAVAAMIRDGSYRLSVLKQPGTVAHALTLDLAFGKNLMRAEPPEGRDQWGDANYRVSTDLRRDRAFEIGFSR